MTESPDSANSRFVLLIMAEDIRLGSPELRFLRACDMGGTLGRVAVSYTQNILATQGQPVAYSRRSDWAAEDALMVLLNEDYVSEIAVLSVRVALHVNFGLQDGIGSFSDTTGVVTHISQTQNESRYRFVLSAG